MSQHEIYDLLKALKGSATAAQMYELARVKGIGPKNLYRDLAGLRKNGIVQWIPDEHRYVLIGRFEREEKPADLQRLIIVRK